uniref:hypothetical protein n=1 Tax=Endozoicomonas sp. ALC013 TaxID=3403076 RepID=UPI003BB58939
MNNEELLVHSDDDDDDEAHFKYVTSGLLQSPVRPFAQLSQYGLNLLQHIGLTWKFFVHSALTALKAQLGVLQREF